MALLEVAAQAGCLPQLSGVIPPLLNTLLAISSDGQWPPPPLLELQQRVLSKYCYVGKSTCTGSHMGGLFSKPEAIHVWGVQVVSLLYPGRIVLQISLEEADYAFKLPSTWFDPSTNYCRGVEERFIIGDINGYIPKANFHFLELKRNRFLFDNNKHGSLSVRPVSEEFPMGGTLGLELFNLYDVNREIGFISRLLLRMVASNLARLAKLVCPAGARGCCYAQDSSTSWD
jgi:hypothetical protein